jgi:hypothetical protein
MNNSNLSLANRKQLADLLADRYDSLRSKVKSKMREKRSELEEALIRELAEKKGALKVATQINATKEKLKELRDELAHFGFQLHDDGDLLLAGDAGRALSRALESRIDKELGTLDAIDARFDSTQIAMMTVATLEDAEKLLKSVSSI